jgi:predicted RNA-binding Zn ribbon-like protein
MDFANTQYTPSGDTVELFKSYEDIQDWFLKAGLLNEFSISKTQKKESHYKELIQYRDLIKKNCFAYVESKHPLNTLIEQTNQIILDNHIHPQIIFKEEHCVVEFTTQKKEYNELLGIIAIEVMNLLNSKNAQYIKKCNNHTCSLLFVDTSKNHSRRWCSMETCGNRSKVSNFSKRSKQN